MKDIMKGIDELYALFKKRKRIPLKEAATLLKTTEGTALKWARAMQEEGIIGVEFKGEDIILVWASTEGGRPPEHPEEPRRKATQETEAEFQRLVDEYERKIDEIRRKSTELQELGKERSEMIYTKYIPLERKFEAELQILHDQLADKEKQIGELEKRIRDMPGKVASIEERAHKLEQIEAYARKNVAETKARVQSEVARIQEVQATVESHLKEVAMRIEEQTLKLKLIEKELIRLKKIEQWMEMQQTGLEDRLSEVSSTRKASLKQYSALRSTLTADYIRNYMKELATLKERHAREIYDIKGKEEELNENVKQAKRELGKLTSESRLIIERFEKVSQKRKHAEKAVKDFGEEREQFERDLEALSSQNIE